MKKLLLLLGTALMLSFAGCESFGGDDVVGGSYSIGGAIQKGPFIQGSNITIQPLNENLKPIGQMYTTLTTNDAGMFEMEGVNSKYAEIIATGYYYDEVEGKISASPLTLRSIADLQDGTQTNVNLLTSLTYNRIKNLVTNDGKGISEAQEQAENELYTTLGIPEDMQPSANFGTMNIASNGDDNGLLLAVSVVLQNGRSVGELSEYIAKFSTDLADDGAIQQELLQKFCVYGFQSSYYEDNVIPNLEERYNSLGIEYTIPNFVKYLPYLNFKVDGSECVVYFTYDEDFVASNGFNEEIGREEYGIDELVFDTDVEFLGYEYFGGYGVIYLSAAPTTLNSCYCDALTSITLPDSVISIGNEAFAGCLRLTNITIPDSVISIGFRAFQRCTSLTSITIPDGVTQIGDMAFGFCESLTSVTIPDSVTSIGDDAFAHCSSLSNIVIPKNVTEIGFCAFNDCSSLAIIYCKPTTPPNCRKAHISDYWLGFFNETMPIIYVPNESVDAYKTSYKWRAYADIIVGYDFLLQKPIIPNNQIWYSSSNGNSVQFNRDDIATFGAYIVSNTYSNGNGIITFDGSVTSIGDYAFSNCTSLISVSIPDSVTSIGRSAFSSCTSLTSITIPDSVTSIGDDAFSDCTSLTSITIPESVSQIGAGVFSTCDKLTTITIPNSVTSIGDWAFFDCTSLTSVTIGNGVTSIGDWAFFDCTSLTSIDIPNGVTSIGNNAFSDCTSLTSIAIGNGVTSIGFRAFWRCTSLTSITIPEGVTQIGELAFGCCESLTSVTIPDSVISIGVSAFAFCLRLAEFSGKFASNDGRCLIVDGVLTSSAPAGLTEYTIPDSVTSIGDYAFSECTSLTSVSIPDGVTSIGDYAFFGCTSLTSVYCKPITPPVGSVHIFYYFNELDEEEPIGCTIYVPTESVDAYKAAPYWKGYADAIVGYDFE